MFPKLPTTSPNPVGSSARAGPSNTSTSPTNSAAHPAHITLPPISSFDSLIRAAEEQYINGAVTANNSPQIGSLSVSPASAIQSRDHNNGHNNALVYQLSTTMTPRSNSTDSIVGLPSPTTASASFFIQQRSTSVDSGSPQINSNRVSKPRKKKECPVCHNFYANLSTHKSTHLTPEDRPHKCSVCSRGFARSNDLLRHKKRHWKDELLSNAPVTAIEPASSLKDEVHSTSHEGEEKSMTKEQLKFLHNIKGTFKCPFNSNLIKLDMELYPYKKKDSLPFETSNCHATGIFSRCDTFKNHLKALHFEYPPGTKKKDRSSVHGRCKHCGEKFANVDIWLNEHVGKCCGYSYH